MNTMYKGLGVVALVIIIGASAFYIGKNYGAVTPEYPVGQAPTNTQTSQTGQGSTVGKTTKPPAACPPTKSGENPKPIIRTISPSSGPVGTKITLTGCGFRGFEGDTDLWFTNSKGVKGVLYGNTKNTGTSITATIPAQLCTQNTSYSGLPCPSYMDMTPGTYSVTEFGYGPSNAVTFTVTSGSASGTPSATIDQNSLAVSTCSTSSSACATTDVTLTGTASAVGMVEVFIYNNKYTYGEKTLGLDHGATVINGHWSFTAKSLPAGTYTVKVTLPDAPAGSLPANATLTTGTLVISPGV